MDTALSKYDTTAERLRSVFVLAGWTDRIAKAVARNLGQIVLDIAEVTPEALIVTDSL